jgi:hypothetical protein
MIAGHPNQRLRLMQTSHRPFQTSARQAFDSSNGLKSPVPLLNGGSGHPAPAATAFCKILAPAVLTGLLWTHVWIGSIAAVFLSVAGLFILVGVARLFGRAGRKICWANQVGFGEKIWLNRLLLPVPPGINYRLTTLYAVFWVGILVAGLGSLTAMPILSATGLSVAYAAQFVWFSKLIDLYQVMKDRNPLYRFWTAEPGNDNIRQTQAVRSRR